MNMHELNPDPVIRSKQEIVADLNQLTSEVNTIADGMGDSGVPLFYIILERFPDLKARWNKLVPEALAWEKAHKEQIFCGKNLL